MSRKKREQTEEAGMVTISTVLPSEWRDRLEELARLRAAAQGQRYSRALLLRDLLAPLMKGVWVEIQATKGRGI